MALSGGLAACGGGGGSTDTSMMPTAQEMCEADGGMYADGTCTTAADQIATLQSQIAALRTQLGLDPSDDIGASITELQTELADLQKQIKDMEDAEAAEERMAMNAMARKLYNGLSGIDSTVADVAVASGSITGTFDTDGAVLSRGLFDH